MQENCSKRRNYRVTVIFDAREQQESPDEMRDRVGKLMESIGAELSASESLGTKAFARCRSKKFREGAYASYLLAAEPSFDEGLLSRLRLDRTVNRTFVEKV
ncbi:MAG: 30S ribosomal protein S6 [Puniceicoccales bacterium]|jgi:ribosomal protein S6|nr:30S ribosomal protein S6 [Puniceicoccales bacterium]